MAHRHSPDSLEYNGFLHDSSLKQVGLKCDSIKNLRLLNATKRVAKCDIPDIHITTQYDLLTTEVLIGTSWKKDGMRESLRKVSKSLQKEDVSLQCSTTSSIVISPIVTRNPSLENFPNQERTHSARNVIRQLHRTQKSITIGIAVYARIILMKPRSRRE